MTDGCRPGVSELKMRAPVGSSHRSFGGLGFMPAGGFRRVGP
jgi:hypothetical protein